MVKEITAEENEITKVSEFLLKFIPEIKVFLFKGNLGSGKTSLIKDLCRRLGVEENVQSPTFSLINEYKTKDDEWIYHLDLYRLKDQEEALNLGIEEYIDGNDVCMIEWPDLIQDLVENHIEVSIEIIGNHRKYLIRKNG